MADEFCKKLERYAKIGLRILDKISYTKDFVESTVKMKPVTESHRQYQKVFESIADKICKKV